MVIYDVSTGRRQPWHYISGKMTPDNVRNHLIQYFWHAYYREVSKHNPIGTVSKRMLSVILQPSSIELRLFYGLKADSDNGPWKAKAQFDSLVVVDSTVECVWELIHKSCRSAVGFIPWQWTGAIQSGAATCSGCMNSESSPCLLGQHGSCITAQRPGELSHVAPDCRDGYLLTTNLHVTTDCC